MNEEMTFRHWLLVVFGLGVLLFALALQGGAFGPSDLELRIRASEPIKLP